MPRTLYLLRHGQTRYNAELRLQGRCNSDLTAKGEAQAAAMGARLRDLLDDAARWTLYASPLGRARQTAQLVCQQLGFDSERIVWDERLVDSTGEGHHERGCQPYADGGFQLAGDPHKGTEAEELHQHAAAQ